MATRETSVMDELRDLTECSICNSMISDPRGLPCIHTFCLECLENFESSSSGKPGDKMLCPVCRKEFTIPPEGMNGFQKNFFVERLTELMKISKPIGNMCRCDACKVITDERETEVEATEYCIQCREKLCGLCSMEHLRNKLSRNHQVVKIGCDVTEILAEKQYSSVCDLHPDEKTKMYCVECRVVICMMCFVESHNSHKCMDVRKAGEKFQENIENDIRKLANFPRETLDLKKQLVQEKRTFMNELQVSERMIKLKCKELKDMVDSHANSLLDELNSVEQRRFKLMDTRKEEVERYLESVDRFTTYSKEIISRGSFSDICRAVHNLYMRADELQKLHEIHVRQKIPSASVTFNEMELQCFLHGNNIVGKLEEKDKRDEEVMVAKESLLPLMKRQTVAIWSVALVSLLAIVAFQYFPNSNVNYVTRLNTSCDHVLSIALSQSGINILCGNPVHIFIYEDQYPFNIRNSLSLDWMIKPEAMVASPSSDSLYVADSETDCIWIISRNGTSYQRTKWMCDDDLRLQSLSRDGSMMYATNEYFWKIKLYNTDYARLVYNFVLPVDSYSQHVVKTSAGDFVVGCRSRTSDRKFICKFNKIGHVVQCYKLTNGSQELNYPIHLSITSDDQVIVSDTHNDRILLLNSDLSWNRDLLTGDDDNGIIKPAILHYDYEKKLFVVVNVEGKVHVYDASLIGL